jgi:hypothetical protein
MMQIGKVKKYYIIFSEFLALYISLLILHESFEQSFWVLAVGDKLKKILEDIGVRFLKTRRSAACILIRGVYVYDRRI